MLPAAAIIFLIGLIDDIFNIKPKQKLLGQFAGAALAIGLGLRYAPGTFVIGSGVMSPWISYPLDADLADRLHQRG